MSGLISGTQEDRQAVPQLHPWYALRVRSNHERVTALHLRQRGYEEFSPCFKSERQWSDRKKTTEQFLFPGYVFCRLNIHERLPVLTAPGVIGLVGFGKDPCPVAEHEMQHVRTMIASGLLITPWPFLERGQAVMVERGPLAGVKGILEEVKGSFRVVVSITLLQRSVSTEVDRSWVRPLPPSHSLTRLTNGPWVSTTKVG